MRFVSILHQEGGAGAEMGKTERGCLNFRQKKALLGPFHYAFLETFFVAFLAFLAGAFFLTFFFITDSTFF